MTDILKELHLSKFIALDLETTGLNPNTDKVIEFSAVIFDNGKKTETLSFLCDPGVEISPEIEILTGITNDMLRGKPAFELQLQEALNFIGDLPLVGHNIGFDLGFLKSYFKRHNDFKRLRLKNPIYDTLLLAQAFYFYLHNHRLSTVAEYCGYSSEGAHRAEADALNTGKIFLKLIEEVIKYNLDTLQIINMILKDTNDPNKWLYQNAAKRLLLQKSIGSSKPPPIDWSPPINIIGKNISVDDQTSIDSVKKSVEKYFGADGILSNTLEKFEPREQQKEMAQHVLESITGGTSAAIEAGTGVGKSLAYLIPSILWLHNNTTDTVRVVIASNTKNLQEQLFFKEIPFVNKTLGLNFKAVMLKGRANYICLTRWNRFISDLGNRLHIANRSSIIPIVVWLKHTKTGDIAENNGFKLNQRYSIWNEICSEPGYCTTNLCQKYNGCYLGKVRYHAVSSNVMIVNHSLLLSDAASENSVLPDYDALIIDEAHNLEKNSYNYFSSKINLPMMTGLLKVVYAATPVERGLIVDVLHLVNQFKKVSEIETYTTKIKDHISDLKVIAPTFYKAILNRSYSKMQSNRGYSLKRRYKRFKDEFPDVSTESNTYIYELSNLVSALNSLVAKTDDIVKDFPKGFDDLKIRLTNIISALETYQSTLEQVTVGDNDELIFWYEVGVRGNEKNIEFACTPLDMSNLLYEKLLSGTHSTILTSATLQVANSFDYILKRTGMIKLNPEDLTVVSVGSPFNYPDQMRFLTYHKSMRESNDLSSITSVLISLAKSFNKGALALFTSYSTLSKVYKGIQPEFKRLGVTLLAQGVSGSRTALLEQFRKEKASVLLGTNSFWEGIDVVGDSLEILLVSKLPFPVPSEPIIEANVEKIKREGGNPFNDYYVPESVLKFRQGIGRLIRSKEDRGIVINLDERIDKKSYGQYFKRSIPVDAVTVVGFDDLMNEIRDFF